MNPYFDERLLSAVLGNVELFVGNAAQSSYFYTRALGFRAHVRIRLPHKWMEPVDRTCNLRKHVRQ